MPEHNQPIINIKGDEENGLLTSSARSIEHNISRPLVLMNQVHFNASLRYPLASLFSLGKVFQAAGQDTLGILKLLAFFHSKNSKLNDTVLALLVFINLLINLSTRANKIFEYCLLPSVYWATNMDNLDLSECDDRKFYIIDDQNNSLHYIELNIEQPKTIPFTDEGKAKLIDLKDQIFREVIQAHFSESTQPNYILISPHFTYLHHRLFRQLNKKRDYPSSWQFPTKILYGFLYGGCAISTVFSGATAYLSGVTLAKACYPKINQDLQAFIGGYVALCAVLAYVSFNLKTMRKSVTNTCDSFNNGVYKEDFGIPVRAMKWTILTTFFGVFASAGMAYFSISNAVKILPWIQDWSTEWQEAIIYTNVIISFFPSIFNFASGCYTQIKNIIPENSDKEISFFEFLYAFLEKLTCMTFFLTFLILIDSVSNSFGTFLGTSELLEKFFNPADSAMTHQILFGLTMVITASNIFLNFGMTMTGTEEAFQKCNACAYGRNKNVLYQPLNSRRNSIDIDPHNNAEDQLVRTITNTSTTSNF